MKTRVLLFFIFTITIFAVGVLIDLLFNTAPGSLKTMTAFYASLFFTLSGLAFFIFYTLIYLKIGNLPSRISTIMQIRLSIYLAIWIISMLALASYHLLNFISAIVVLAALLIFELSFKQSNSNMVNANSKKLKTARESSK